MSARSRRNGVAGGVVAALCAVTACTYDFDKYVTPRSDASAGHANGAGTTGAGRAGASSGGSASGHAGAGGSTTTGGASNGNAGEGGAANEGGAGAIPNSGGSSGRGGGAGHGGTSTGGTATAGTSASGSGTGGKATAGASNGGSAGSAAVPCTEGTTHEGHCYFVVATSSGLDWEHAKSECEASGAHLVTITSSGEQTFVASTFFPSSDDAWIGLSLEDTTSDPSSLCSLLPDSCPFVWLTGEKLEYTAWAMRSGSDDEPNYTGACVRLQASDQAWADLDCSSTFRAVCERDR